MTKGNISLRLLGFILLASSLLILKSDATPAMIWGIPLPFEVVLILLGISLTFAPSICVNILSFVLPKKIGENLREFNEKYIVRRENEIHFDPEDGGEILAEKLNKAIYDSKRRFYATILMCFSLIFLSLLLFLLFQTEKISSQANKVIVFPVIPEFDFTQISISQMIISIFFLIGIGIFLHRMISGVYLILKSRVIE